MAEGADGPNYIGAVGDELVAETDPSAPWPGRMPEPAPSTVLPNVPVVSLEDRSGAPVHVTERGELGAAPTLLRWGSRDWGVQGWAGPWSVDERWWDASAARAASRVQVLLADSRALLLIYERGRWGVEGIYE